MLLQLRALVETPMAASGRAATMPPTVDQLEIRVTAAPHPEARRRTIADLREMRPVGPDRRVAIGLDNRRPAQGTEADKRVETLLAGLDRRVAIDLDNR